MTTYFIWTLYMCRKVSGISSGLKVRLRINERCHRRLGDDQPTIAKDMATEYPGWRLIGYRCHMDLKSLRNKTIKGEPMFDELFGGPSTTEMRDACLQIWTEHLALAMLLAEKGLIDDEELNQSRAKATHIVDQMMAQKKEEAIKEFDEQNPGVREMFAKVLGGKNND